MERVARRHRVDRERAAAARRDAIRDVPPLAARVLALQRSVGNRATCEALASVAGERVLARAGKRKAKAPPPPRTGPKRVRIQTNAVDHERWWAGPAYGGSDKFGGGSSVTADLGPAAGQAVNYGSAPGIQECKAVNKLNKANVAAKLWIKGHLLNDNLGGPGLSENLTPMTHDANMAYKNTFESKVKNAITTCYSHGQVADVNWYGVRMTATVSGQHWAGGATAAERAVAQTVDTTCQYIYKPKAGGAVQPMGQPAWAPALPGALSTHCFQ